MKTNKNCKHCYQLFESRRTNHVYCTTSCKTKASYKRNEYKYVSGHYQKTEIVTAVTENDLPVSNELLNAIKVLESKIVSLDSKPAINSGSVSNAAIGSVTADVAVFAAKKIFAPNMLPATKGDIESLKEELKQLKKTIILYRGNKFPTNF